jgi:predicted metal-dependent phosphotriesterase family hydrolase
MHENHGQTIRAMKYTIIPALKKSGLTPVTVPQMLAGNPPTAKQLSKGRKGCR